jgi:hypothetical protein
VFKKNKPTLPLDIVPPSGLFVKAPGGQVWYVKAGGRYSVSDIHLASWGVTPVSITNTALLLVPERGKIGFRDGTVCQDFGDGRMYLISDSKKRLIANPAVYEALGGDKVCHSVPSEYLRVHAEGDSID